MNTLFNHAVKQSQNLKRDLEQFAESPETAPLSLQGQISATLTSFNRTLDDYQRAAANEMVPERKEKAQVRIETFRGEIHQAKERFKELKQQREESLHQDNKQELFARRVQQHHPAENSENPYGSQPEYTNIAREDGLRSEQNVLGRVGEQLDYFLEQGQATLEDLSMQSKILRDSRQTMVSVFSTLGMSSETIRMVERRAFQDKWIFYFGAFLMFCGFYFILKWFG